MSNYQDNSLIKKLSLNGKFNVSYDDNIIGEPCYWISDYTTAVRVKLTKDCDYNYLIKSTDESDSITIYANENMDFHQILSLQSYIEGILSWR